MDQHNAVSWCWLCCWWSSGSIDQGRGLHVSPHSHHVLMTWVWLELTPCSSVNADNNIQHPLEVWWFLALVYKQSKTCFQGPGMGLLTTNPLSLLGLLPMGWLQTESALVLSKYRCSLWNWFSADSFGFSINPRRDQHFALKSLSSSNWGMDKGKCLHNLFANQICKSCIALKRHKGDISPCFDFGLARQSCPAF